MERQRARQQKKKGTLFWPVGDRLHGTPPPQPNTHPRKYQPAYSLTLCGTPPAPHTRPSIYVPPPHVEYRCTYAGLWSASPLVCICLFFNQVTPPPPPNVEPVPPSFRAAGHPPRSSNLVGWSCLTFMPQSTRPTAQPNATPSRATSARQARPLRPSGRRSPASTTKALGPAVPTRRGYHRRAARASAVARPTLGLLPRTKAVWGCGGACHTNPKGGMVCAQATRTGIRRRPECCTAPSPKSAGFGLRGCAFASGPGLWGLGPNPRSQ